MRSAITKDPVIQGICEHRPLYPVKQKELWRMFKKAEASFWTSEEIDIHQDKADWVKNLGRNDRENLSRLLVSFAISSQNSSLFLTEALLKDVKYREAKFFFARQLMMENTHYESASLLLDQLTGDRNYINEIFNTVQTDGSLLHQREWLKDLSGDDLFRERLIAMFCAKKLFNTSLHAVLFWFKKKGSLPGLSFWNELINRDEKLHAEFSLELYEHHLEDHLESEKVINIVGEAVKITNAITAEALDEPIEGLSINELRGYTNYVADKFLAKLFDQQHQAVDHPIPWIDSVTLHQRALSSTYDQKFNPQGVVVPSDDQKAFDLSEGE